MDAQELTHAMTHLVGATPSAEQASAYVKRCREMAAKLESANEGVSGREVAARHILALVGAAKA